MKIYTKTGDKGNTSLIGGVRVSKSDERVEAIGSIDELNAHIGMLRDSPVNTKRVDDLIQIQKRLFDIGALLATTKESTKKIPAIIVEDVDFLEKSIDEMTLSLEPLRSFVLPGGHVSISHGHIARCVCRKAERQIVGLTENIPSILLQYINRLSDYLFVLCRIMHLELGIKETPWIPRTNK